ncbi:MAG: LysR family transcriptional regulator [Gammaproteobacteria bacterium]
MRETATIATLHESATEFLECHQHFFSCPCAGPGFVSPNPMPEPRNRRKTAPPTAPARRPAARLPGLLSLQSFEAAARLGTVSHAAKELRLTQSAVSKQLQTLEARLGRSLFTRDNKGMRLTEAGAAYLHDVRVALDTLHRGTENIAIKRERHGALKIATLPTFGSKWLIPRLPRFRQAHPNITLELITRLAPFDFSIDPFDAAIHFGGADWPGAASQYLAEEEMVALAVPALAAMCSSPADVQNLPHIAITTRAFAWHEWFAAMNLQSSAHRPALQVETFAMGIEAVRAGLGVAIFPVLFAEHELTCGELTAIGPRVRSGGAYHLVYPHHKRNDPLVRAFASWLTIEAEEAKSAT